MLIITYVVEENVFPEVCLLQCLHGNLTWTLKIFLNQEAIKLKTCFRRPSLIQYFLLDLWCSFSSCRFPPCIFPFPYVPTYACLYMCFTCARVSVLLVCFHNVLLLHLISQPQLSKTLSSGIQPTFFHGNCIKVHKFSLGVLV